jgi:hypothetical protein
LSEFKIELLPNFHCAGAMSVLVCARLNLSIRSGINTTYSSSITLHKGEIDHADKLQIIALYENTRVLTGPLVLDNVAPNPSLGMG